MQNSLQSLIIMRVVHPLKPGDSLPKDMMGYQILVMKQVSVLSHSDILVLLMPAPMHPPSTSTG